MKYTAPELNLTIDRGADFTLQLAITEDDGITAVDCTGYTFAADIRPDFDSDVLTSFNITEVNLANGNISVSLTDEQTAALTYDRCVYDVKMTDASGVVTYLMRGRLIIQGRVTE